MSAQFASIHLAMIVSSFVQMRTIDLRTRQQKRYAILLKQYTPYIFLSPVLRERVNRETGQLYFRFAIGV